MSGPVLNVGSVGARENLAVVQSSVSALVAAICYIIICSQQRVSSDSCSEDAF